MRILCKINAGNRKGIFYMKKEHKTETQTEETRPEETPETNGVTVEEDQSVETKSAPGNTDTANKKSEEESESAEVAAAKSEIEKLRDRLLRLQADFDNFRKRVARENLELIKSANGELIESLLPVLDHFGHALESMEKTGGGAPEAYAEGVRIINSELLRTLEHFGLSRIDCVGKEFDANLHEALSTMPGGNVKPGCIVAEIRKGYTLNGKVLRAPQVIVAAENPGEPAEE